MRTRQYRSIAKAIAAHDGGGIWERWRYGRLLLVGDETTAAGNLRDGVIDKLIAASAADGVTISRREIQRCLQAGRAYPSEAELRQALAQYETWWDLAVANFPKVPRPEEATDYDPRETAELTRQHDQRGARLLPDSEQLAWDLFPKSDVDDTLADLDAYAREQAEITARFTARDARRREYLDRLIEAANEDMTMRFGEARRLLGDSSDDDQPERP